MIVTTGFNVEGQTVVEYLGVVRGIVVRAYYSGLLHRSQPPSQSEVNFWVLSSLDLGNMRVLFESTQEYYFNS